jgi:hypothetical protein
VLRVIPSIRDWRPGPLPRVWVALALSAGLFCVGGRAFHPFTGVVPHIDSGVYLAAGSQILSGKVLYREVWDHKPPLVHLVNAAALAAGDHTVNAVRSLERVLAGVLAVVAFWTLLLAFESPFAASLGSLLLVFLFYSRRVIRGNQPEEYGAILAMLAVLLVLAAAREGQRRPVLLVVASGLVFGLSSLAKETFALGAIPWFVWVCALAWPDRRAVLTRGVAFLAAAALPWVVFYAWLLVWGLLPQWIEVLRFNMGYLRFDASNAPNPGFWGRLWLGWGRVWLLVIVVSKVTAGLAALGVAGLAIGAWRRRTRWLPLVLTGFFLACLVAVSQGRRYDYYLVQVVGSFVLLAASGVALLLWLARGRRLVQVGVGCGLVLALVLVDRVELARFARGLAGPRQTFGEQDPTVAAIVARSANGETVWNLARETGWIYAHADRTAPTRFYYLSANLFRDLPDPEAARREIQADVMTHPPRLIVHDGQPAWLDKVGLRAWFEAHYAPTDIPRLFERKPNPVASP